ncbi:ankyrin repeat domain-containing protein [Cardinium endosymbiont of Philonthus spinipes]|uniref:ankyrin repeat domain-containing protein n=1 Tax=Cardinium endosymbiont of Philonthus spinipes TaxID=3077941 RepID=UPI00313DEA26
MNRKVILFSSIVLFYLGCSRVYNLSQLYSPSVGLKNPQDVRKQAADKVIQQLLEQIHDKKMEKWWRACIQSVDRSSKNVASSEFPLHAFIKDFQSTQRNLKKCKLSPVLQKKCIELFIDYHRESSNLLDNKGWAPLHIAVFTKNLQAMRYLLAHAHNKINVDIWSSNGYTPLHLAVENGYVEIAKLLLEYRANVNEPCRHYFLSMFTPLHLAAMFPHTKTAKAMISLLLEYGADANAQDSFGRTANPMHSAHAGGFIKQCVKLTATIM